MSVFVVKHHVTWQIDVMQPIEQPKSLTETTADRIRDAIISGELPLGSKLSEQRLADMLHVSRSPVRDALAILQSEGLVEVSPKSGSYVFTPDLREVDELCEHRAVLEAAAIRMAISRNHGRLVELMSQSVAEMRKALRERDTARYTRGDLLFHQAIVDCCGNRSIIKAYRRAISPVKALRTHLFTILNATLKRSMDDHLALLAACRASDGNLAARLLEEHVGHLVEAFRTALADREAPQFSSSATRRSAERRRSPVSEAVPGA